jgi:antitoxin component YwqK of YwqJK toxin-antitoxin module
MTRQYSIWIVAIVALICAGCTHTETTYYPDGRTQSVIQYRGKKEHGKTVYYYQNPNIVEMEVEMKNGKRNGEFRRYYVNGMLDTYCVFENDSIEGVEATYLANGCKNQETTYHHGKKEGPYKEYHNDGSLKVEGAFKNDLIEGPWNYYDERGVLIGEGEFHEGNGEVTFYDKNGRPERTVCYKKNKKDGKEVHYTPSGQIYREITFKEDRIISDNTDSTLLK